MPFYAATKAFFKKGIPLFKEVVVPESVDYEKKLIELLTNNLADQILEE